MNHELRIKDLHASAGGKEVLRGINLTIEAGQVHVVMGPNGSGKSTLAHALMGRPGTEITKGSIKLNGVELSKLPTWKRARKGLFLALQQPIEVPGVSMYDALEEAMLARDTGKTDDDSAFNGDITMSELVKEAALIGLDWRLVGQSLNLDFSGGEKKRGEIVQLAMLRPPFCVLDEIDSGLDVDALSHVAKRIEAATKDWGMGVLAVTHFHRLLVELKADHVHVLVGGEIVASGGEDLAKDLESTGYSSLG